MKVVKPPVKKVTKDPLYEVECPVTVVPTIQGCGAVLQFHKSEIHHISDQRDGDAEYIVCPCCGRTIWNDHFNRFHEVKEQETEHTEEREPDVEHPDFVMGDLVKVTGPFMAQGKIGYISHIYKCDGVYFFDIIDKTDTTKVYTVWGDNAITKI